MPTATRIAFVAPRFADGPTVGGAETLLRALAEHAAAAGREVAFLTTCAQDHFTWKNVLPPGVRQVGRLTVRFFPVDEDRDADAFQAVQSRICRGAAVSPEEEQLWLRHSVNSRELCRHLREEGAGYDRIVAGPYLFGVTVQAARVRPDRTLLVPCLHDEPFAYLQVIRELFRGAAGILFNADAERALAERLFAIDPARCAVVGMGLDDFTADPEAFRRAHRLDRPYLIYSGRREPLKGTPLLLDYLDVFREHTRKDVQLVLTGAGPVSPPPALAPHVLDLGFVSEAEKHNAMAGALAFCHPSVNESLSIVLLESWLAGAPVLVHAGSAVMLDHCRRSGGGLWFANYPEFEEELLVLLERDTLRREMGQAGRRYVLERYSWRAIGSRLLDALDRFGAP
jgi:glycosyltransferase involved in cell wall biosynthesis